jgi:DNA-binding transcriptional MocR family regulator
MTWPLDAENPDLAPALRRLARRTDLAELLTYAPNAGRLRHREAGAAWIAHHGLDVDPERILVCAGAQHAMTVVVATLLRPGDTLLTESLTYPGMRAVAELLGCRLQGLELDEEGIVPDALDAACRGRGKRPRVLYTVPTLQNPTTATQTEGRRRALAELARRHDLSIVEDAIHHLLVRDVPPLLATFAPERTFLIASPSKVVAGGLRVAWLAAPADAIRRLTHNVWATNWMAAPLNAELFATWIEDGTALATVERKQAEAAARARLAGACLRGRLEGLEDGGGARLLLPPATYHAWLELPPGWTDGLAFAAAAECRGVVVTPAESFVASGRAPAGVRISLSAPRTRDALRRGLERVADALADGPRVAAENARAGTAIV